MHFCHCILRCTIDFCSAPFYIRVVWEMGATRPARLVEAGIRRAVTTETAMKKFSLTRFLRTRRVYWHVLQELSAYTDRELHDIGIDRVDIHQIARLASQENV